ncbi:TonB-dependent receptor domain-containing protein [Pseudoalteromonas denitrificans]|uniref:Outer membrane cobalamin receptor protein n=1 Tax=Pseudoalteromonas denitrificans DSM 6059 TaxID=1123010 RepID=A0A1I1S4E8_9GAMM|nr:TonB-dependent receptor [Pseudoalteromonas denitrificans]SFD41247.1 Outer membrane cobalamin receptor protein [Pseudoalteromonas denitrificans DSM 6059]
MMIKTSPYRYSIISHAVKGAIALAGISLVSIAPSVYAADDESVERISVTGSRIQRTSAQMATPTTVIDAQAIEMSGVKNIGDLMNQLPALVDGTGGATAQSPNGKGLGTAGIELANLRGLGSVRTLVLVNGRRHVAGAAGESSVDLAMIPTALVERIEIITGGASAVYGADAVTGVINFIMKKDYEGFEIEASAGQSAQSDAETKDLSFTYGQNFDNGKGNFTAHLSYSDRDELRMDARKHSSLNPSFLSNPENTGPDDGIANLKLAKDLRFQALSSEGLIYVPNENWIVPGQSIVNFPGPTFAGDPQWIPGTPFGYDTYTIDRIDGHFREFIPGVNCDGPVKCDGGDGFRTPETSTLITPSERVLFNVTGQYDVNSDLRLFTEAKYGRAESFARGQASFFHDDNFGPLVALKQDNPFIPNELKTLMQERGLDEVGLATVPLSSSSDNKRETFQFTFGGQGALEDYDYNFYLQHGRVKATLLSQDTLIDKYYDALDATTDVNGNAVCRSGNTGCAPFNPIFKQASAEALAYAGVFLKTEEEIQQSVASLSFNGELFDLPAGSIAFAAGVEYRKEESDSIPDPLTQGVDENGQGLGLVGSTQSLNPAENSYLGATHGSYSVSEIFGELNVPLLEDLPGIEYLEADFAARYADHSVTGGDSTYKLGLNWSIAYDVSTRATYSKAVRAPNIQELFAPNSIAGARVNDACSRNQLDSVEAFASNRKKNCAQLGLSPEFSSNADNGTISHTTSGNPELKPEEAETLTVGITYAPNSNFSIAVDYWDIEITDAITQFKGTDVLGNCVNSAELDNTFCDLVTRGDDGNIKNIDVTSINAAKFSAKGTDIDVNLGLDLDEARLNFAFKGTYLDERETQQNASDPRTAKNLAGSATNSDATPYPHFRALITTTYSMDNFSTSWTTNYVGDMTYNKLATNETYGSEFNNKVDSYMNHNLRFQYNYDKSTMLFLGINNVADKKPSALPSLNQGGLLYDAIGRRYTAGIKISL